MVSPIDSAIAGRAQRHGGHVTRQELMELGLTPKAIRHRLRRGLLIEVYYGVYAVGHLPTNPIDGAHGALLAAGPRSALSHGSAGSVFRIYKRWGRPLEVTIPADRRPRGLIVHHSRLLTQADITLHEGLRVTSPARTLLDLAPRLTPKRRVRVFNELRMEHGMKVEEVESLLSRFPRHPGARLIRPIIGSATDEPSRSHFEDDWPRFAEQFGLTGWELNRHVCGHRVDVLFLPDLLIVELDGWQTHGSRPSFEADREQDADILTRAGIPTLRITYPQFHSTPAKQARRIHAVLAARRQARQAA